MDRTSLIAARLRDLARDIAVHGGRRGAVAAGLMVAGAALEGVGLAFLLPLLALLTGQGGGRLAGALERGFATVGVAGRTPRLALVLGLFLAVLAVRALVVALRDRRVAALQLGFIEQQRLRLVAALGAAGWADIAGLRHARITSALDGDILRIAAASQLLLQTATAIVMLAAQWLTTLLIAPVLAVLALPLMLLALLALRPALRSADAAGRALGRGNLALLDTAAQLLGGLKLAIAQNLQAAFAAEFGATARALTQGQLAYRRGQSTMRAAAGTVAAVAGVAMLLAGLWLGLPAATLLTALAIFARMGARAAAVMQSALLLVGNLPAHAALATLRAELAPTGMAPSPPACAPPAGEIVFEGVRYRHAGGAGVAGLTLSIQAGEIVGITGASGAGKTTFVDLLAGLLIPDAGTIRIGGVPLAAATAPHWRDRIAYVAQDAYLFHDSIRRNLGWGSGPIDDARMWQALALAGADEVVRRWPDELDTIVGERGARLSGGERQRVALARAVLRRPALMILDEATNAIDVATERAILERLAALVPRPTLVIVAHRAETLAICERLVTFDRGTLAG